MRFPNSVLLSASLALTIHAFPAPAPAATYSVVDVDGGNNAPANIAVPPATTVTAQPQTELSTVKIYKTVTPAPVASEQSEANVDDNNDETTISATLIPQPALSRSSSPPSSNPTTPAALTTVQTLIHTTTTIINSVTTVITTTELVPTTATLITTATTTATPSPRSTSYYDDGMWRTSYAIPENPTYAHTWPASHWEQEGVPVGVQRGVGEKVAGTGVGARGAVVTGLVGGEEGKGWNVVSWNETGAADV